MARITGRTDDMLVVKGVNVFPSQIESVLLRVGGVLPHYQIVVNRQHAFSYRDLEVWAEVDEGISQDAGKMDELRRTITAEMQSLLGISIDVRLVPPNTLARVEGKTKRLMDRSELG
jgi:phenylacetate-CoA ligase